MCLKCGQPDNVRCTCEVTQPYCDQCGDENACEEKMDAHCVYFHLNCDDLGGLPNLGIECNTDLETILERLDDLVGNYMNIPFEGQESESIEWVAGGPAGHKPTAKVKISEEDDNILELLEDGLYVPETVFVPDYKVKVNSTDAPDYLKNQMIGDDDGIIYITTTDIGGLMYIVPAIDIVALVAAIISNSEAFTALCNAIELCGGELPACPAPEDLDV